MKNYRVKAEVFYTEPPHKPQIKVFELKAKNDEVAEAEARLKVAVSIGHNQSARLLTLTRLEEVNE